MSWKLIDCPASSVAVAGPRVTFASALRVNSFTQTSGSGETRFEGPVTIKGAAVTSLNSLTDDVLLQGGNNVTVTQDGNTLTIAASGSVSCALTGRRAFRHGSSWDGNTPTR